SPLAVKPTTDGVVRAPSALGITRTSGSPAAPIPSRTATHEFVVPKSIPMILAMGRESILAPRPGQEVLRGFFALAAALMRGARLDLCRASWASWRLGDHDHGRANQPLALSVTGLHLSGDGTWRMFFSDHLLDRLVDAWIER